uniref:Uncharacterized protein n=1 Tax=Setaria italica TaxID=4555 RepID=K3YFR6_SETIT
MSKILFQPFMTISIHHGSSLLRSQRCKLKYSKL